MSVQVKICGIASVEAADAAAKAGADYAGLVFFRRSPRYLQLAQAMAIAERLRGRSRTVALIVDATDAEIESVARAVKPDILQLHGNETVERVAAIKSRWNIPVMKALAIAEAGDFASVAAYERVADMLLFDAKAPANATRPGGHGASFDWQLLRGRTFSRPWLLGGGLNAENVARAIGISGAAAVDCSSGVETALGIKDPQLIRDFVAAARSAQYAEAER
ncbi:MAG TPA: phosphoribosylanthranilate isomerase [Rhizomicrobium sp.]|nr:phosphoribosylanthranilate isomerase [Rhizomicrobium sp.]